MAINYTLSIGNLTKKFTVGEFNNVIVDVAVGVSASSDPITEVTGTDVDGNDILKEIAPAFTYSCSGVISFDTSELTEETFVDFDSITKDTVIGWILQKEGVETVEEFSYVKYSIENIQQQIDALQEVESVSFDWSVTNAPAEDPNILSV